MAIIAAQLQYMYMTVFVDKFHCLTLTLTNQTAGFQQTNHVQHMRQNLVANRQLDI